MGCHLLEGTKGRIAWPCLGSIAQAVQDYRYSTSTTEEMTGGRGVSYIPSCIAKSTKDRASCFSSKHGKGSFHGVAEEKGWQACPRSLISDRNQDKTRSHSNTTRYVEGPLPLASLLPTDSQVQFVT